MTEPKKVSDFAREYQQMYIANVQLNSAVIRLRDDNDELRRQINALTKINEHLKTLIIKQS